MIDSIAEPALVDTIYTRKDSNAFAVGNRSTRENLSDVHGIRALDLCKTYDAKDRVV